MFSVGATKNSGSILNFDIYFVQNNVLRSDPIYRPGDYVEGYCVVNCKGRMKIDAIEAKMFGRAKVFTSEYKDYQTQDHVYIAEEQTIYEPTKFADGDQGMLKDGYHKFKFSFKLPDDIPSTFIHYNGHIKYSVKAVIVKPIINQNIERFFTVYAPLSQADCEPSTSPFAKKIEALNFSSFCYWLRCFPNGTVAIEAQTDKYVYIIGEVITVNCVFKNYTPTIIEPEVKLQQIIKFTANGVEKTKEVEVSYDFIVPTLEPNSTRNFISKIDIPKYVDDIPVSATLTNCQLIKVTYCVVVALRKARLRIPVVLENSVFGTTQAIQNNSC